MDLEKKLKRKKNAEIVETCDESFTEDDLQEILNKYTKVSKVKNAKDDAIKKYTFKNVKTNETIISIYDNLDNIPNINKEEWKV